MPNKPHSRDGKSECPTLENDGRSRQSRRTDLPMKARGYLKAIAELTGANLFIASVGPGREQTIFV